MAGVNCLQNYIPCTSGFLGHALKQSINFQLNMYMCDWAEQLTM